MIVRVIVALQGHRTIYIAYPRHESFLFGLFREVVGSVLFVRVIFPRLKSSTNDSSGSQACVLSTSGLSAL